MIHFADCVGQDQPLCIFKFGLALHSSTIPHNDEPFPKREILDSSKLKEFADDFKFDENGRKFSKRLENTVGKGEIPRYEQFLLFPQCFPADTVGKGEIARNEEFIFFPVFSKDLCYRHVNIRDCLGKG